MSAFSAGARVFNSLFTPLLSAPVIGRRLRGTMTEISYRGKRSGKEFTLPVAYRRRGTDEVIVGVALPEKKSWWRNFEPGPWPIGIALDGVARSGQGRVTRGDNGTAVVITLDPIA